MYVSFGPVINRTTGTFTAMDQNASQVQPTANLHGVDFGQRAMLQGHTNTVRSVVFSPDGKYICSGSYDNTVRLWNTETGETVRTLEGHTNWVTSVSFSPDGKYVCSGSYDKTVRQWNTETGELIRTLEGHMSYVNSVAFSPDGKFLCSGSGDGTQP